VALDGGRSTADAGRSLRHFIPEELPSVLIDELTVL
jgi:hypothetical protein